MLATTPRFTAWIVGSAVAVGVVGWAAVEYGKRYHAALDAQRAALAVERATHETLSLLKDAETGQRGFLLSEQTDFLEPYRFAERALPEQLRALRAQVARDRGQAASVARLSELAQAKMAELAESISLQRGGRSEEALAGVREGRGRRLMVAIRAETAAMLRAQEALSGRARAAAEASLRRLLSVFVGTWMVLVCAVAAGLWSAAMGLSAARRAAARIEKSERAMRAVAENASDLVRVIGSNAEPVYVSPSCERILGFTREEMLAMPPRALLPEEELESTIALTRRVRSGAVQEAPYVHRLRTKDGSYRWFETSYRRVDGSAEAADHIHLISRDITERREAEEALRRQSEKLRTILASMSDGVAVLGRDRRLLLINRPAQRFLPLEEGDLVPADWGPRNCFQLDGVTPLTPEEAPMSIAMQGVACDDLQLMVRRDGAELRTLSVSARPLYQDDTIFGCVAVLHDVSEQRNAEQALLDSEQRLQVLANVNKERADLMRVLSLRDELTGLYNRRGFTELGEQALRTQLRSNKAACLFFADLDGLKLINDTLGHEIGDHAIATTSKLLVTVFRDSDVLARLGGDEFAVLALSCELADIPSVLERLENQVAAANAETRDYTLSISVGTAIFDPHSPVSLNELMDLADHAMYEQKRLAKQRPA